MAKRRIRVTVEVEIDLEAWVDSQSDGSPRDVASWVLELIDNSQAMQRGEVTDSTWKDAFEIRNGRRYNGPPKRRTNN